jgi:hypothetical protein
LQPLTKIYPIGYIPKQIHIWATPRIIPQALSAREMILVSSWCSQSWEPLYHKVCPIIFIYLVIYDLIHSACWYTSHLVCQFFVYMSFRFPSAKVSMLNHVQAWQLMWLRFSRKRLLPGAKFGRKFQEFHIWLVLISDIQCFMSTFYVAFDVLISLYEWMSSLGSLYYNYLLNFLPVSL